MEIIYQKQLEKYPSITSPTGGFTDSLRPLTIAQIEQLEHEYNEGKPFPQSLRELLYLAGGYCYVLDYGLNDTQQELQEDTRSYMAESYNANITSPFYVIDVYNALDQFLFVYLDKDNEAPFVYEAYMPDYGRKDKDWLRKFDSNLSQYTDKCMERLLHGYNPF